MVRVCNCMLYLAVFNFKFIGRIVYHNSYKVVFKDNFIEVYVKLKHYLSKALILKVVFCNAFTIWLVYLFVS